MKYAVISDVHANEEALKAVLCDASKQGVEAVLCLGDVVGYGPLPEQAVRLVRENCFATVAGNHDDAVCGRGDPSQFVDLAADAAKRHRRQLSQEAISWLEKLPYVLEKDGFAAVHGDFSDPRAFGYIETVDEARENFALRKEQLLFAGHTHVPGIFLTGRSGAVYFLEPQDFTLEDGKRYIVNPGSVGYPRESGGKCISTYVIYDSTEKTVIFRRLPFSVSSVMQRGGSILKRGRMYFAALAAVAVAGAVAAALLVRSGGTEVPPPVQAAAETPVKTVEMEIAPADKSIVPALKLAKGSPHVRLRIEYLGADGSVLFASDDIVKSSRGRRIDIPAKAEGASRVRLSVWKMDGAAPSIAEFSVSK